MYYSVFESLAGVNYKSKLDRDLELELHFKQIGNLKTQTKINRIKLKRSRLKNFILKEHSKWITDKFFEHVNLPQEISFDEFCNAFDKVERFALKLAFNIYDSDGDGKITLHDLFDQIKPQENKHMVYISDDIYIISNHLLKIQNMMIRKAQLRKKLEK